MFGLTIQNVLGALVIVVVAVTAINFLGDKLVVPKKNQATGITVATKAPAPPKEPEKVVPLAVRLASADAKAGAKVFNKCKSCHDVSQQKKNKIGPPLWDIVQANIGGAGGYSYSSAMSGKGGKWSFEDLDSFIASPKGFLKGTKMTFRGIKDGKDRANLIAYLRNLSSAPKPLPK
jgi:cytochrome c